MRGLSWLQAGEQTPSPATGSRAASRGSVTHEVLMPGLSASSSGETRTAHRSGNPVDAASCPRQFRASITNGTCTWMRVNGIAHEPDAEHVNFERRDL